MSSQGDPNFYARDTQRDTENLDSRAPLEDPETGRLDEAKRRAMLAELERLTRHHEERAQQFCAPAHNEDRPHEPLENTIDRQRITAASFAPEKVGFMATDPKRIPFLDELQTQTEQLLNTTTRLEEWRQRQRAAQKALDEANAQCNEMIARLHQLQSEIASTTERIAMGSPLVQQGYAPPLGTKPTQYA
jgi:DNA repair exonuclease SbcCD ATPase subunit